MCHTLLHAGEHIFKRRSKQKQTSVASVSRPSVCVGIGTQQQILEHIKHLGNQGLIT